MASNDKPIDLKLRYLKPDSLHKIFKFCEELSLIYRESCMGPLLGPLQLASLNEYAITVVSSLSELAMTIDRVVDLTEYLDTYDHVKKAVADKAAGVLSELSNKTAWMDGTLCSDKRITTLVNTTVHYITRGIYPKIQHDEDQ